MKDYKTIKLLFNEIADSISFLSDSDIEKLVSGEYQISIKVQRKKNVTNSLASFESKSSEYENILSDLNLIKNREAGAEFLNDKLKNKVNFEKFAKFIDVAVMKSDKVEKIRDNIIETTIGARLRSEAIQNKNTEGKD
ncbi:hypothetical protein [Pantoea ananatis]|uniref:hypothetical protein n=1 Tax=Pantoea ananas TaxID=553 RepID=UPI0013760965|nr:hypothetical protein [Pantoea ananatis]NCU06766.1 hypothetical protein [Pantoea ananatis]